MKFLTPERADARSCREQIIALYEHNGFQRFRELFDWYYGNQGEHVSWILHNGQHSVSGLCSVIVREFRFDDEPVRVGVLGNLIVDHRRRAPFAAFSLVRAAKALVDTGEFDVILGVPNGMARPVILRMGAQIIGLWQTRAQVFCCRDLLRARFGKLVAKVSPLMDLIAACRRRLRTWPTLGETFQLFALSERELAHLDVADWQAPRGRFVARQHRELLRWRYGQHPFTNYEILGIRNRRSGRLCGYLVTSTAPGRTYVCDCRTDASQLSESEAVLVLCLDDRARDCVISVPVLRSSRIDNSLASWGFFRVTERLGGYPSYPLVGFWRPDHKLAGAFADPGCWHLFVGFNDV